MLLKIFEAMCLDSYAKKVYQCNLARPLLTGYKASCAGLRELRSREQGIQNLSTYLFRQVLQDFLYEHRQMGIFLIEIRALGAITHYKVTAPLEASVLAGTVRVISFKKSYSNGEGYRFRC